MHQQDPDPVDRYAHDHSVQRMVELDAAAIEVGYLSRRHRWIRVLFKLAVAFVVLTFAGIIIYNLATIGQIAP